MDVNEITILTQMAAINKMFLKLQRLKKGVSFVFCPRSRSRMQWDIMKTEFDIKEAQSSYIKNCDGHVTDRELEDFLQNQNIHDTREP